MDVDYALTRLGNVQSAAAFLIAQDGGVAGDPIEGGDVPTGVGLMLDVDEPLFDQTGNQLANRLYIDARLGGDSLQSVVDQAKVVLPLVLGAPQEIVDLLFHQR